MSIFDRARDALKNMHDGPWLFRDMGDDDFPEFQVIQGSDETANPYLLIAKVEEGFGDDDFDKTVNNAKAIALTPELLAAVLRAADLADWYERTDDYADTADVAKQIRAALEGETND